MLTVDEQVLRVSELYDKTFGVTPLFRRLDDIQEETEELAGWTSEANLKEETSDLLCTLLALIAEKRWSFDELVQMNIDKINERVKSGHYLRTGEQRSYVR